MCSKSLIGERVQLAGASIMLDGSIELRCVERLKPRAEPRKFVRRKPLNGLFDFFGGGHLANISPAAL